ncbi:MAG: MliC family protein [Pararhodobacter sp.]|nr:MliC family protein [Pararhodobacter sp.]
MALNAGLYKCELNRNVMVRTIAADGASIVLAWGGRDHAFKAVQARTGALRFENADEGLVWLVIVGKAMLLDTRKGKQLANECRN